MQIVSDAVRQLLDSHAKVALAVYIDGEKLDVGVGAGSYTGACAGDEEFSFGNACAAGASVSLAVSRPDLKGRRIQITWAVNGTEYPLIAGRVEKAKVAAGRTEVEAWDDMYFAGSDAFTIASAVAGTCTAAAAFSAVADAMGVSADPAALALLSGITIPDGLSGLGSEVTNSAVAGYIAGLVGGNALMNRAGLLTIRQYKAVDWETEPYSGGANAENEDFTVTGITLQREKTVSTLNDDGSTTERTSTEECVAGDGSLMLTNPLSSQAAADGAFAALSAVTVRPGNYSFPGGLLLEPGDIFTICSMDGSYAVAVGSISMSFDGGVRSSVACGGAAGDSGGSKGAINQALVALLADYAKFKKLVADNVEINSANILELIVGDIIADRIKAGIIKSKDGTSVVIDLDKGEGTFTGEFRTTKQYRADGNVYRSSMSPFAFRIAVVDNDTGEEMSEAMYLTRSALSLSGSPSAEGGGTGITLDDSYVGSVSMGTARPVYPVEEDTTAKTYFELRNDVAGTILSILLQNREVHISGLTDPWYDDQAATKGYVDAGDNAVKDYAKTLFSNPNLLDNWYFADPVNQRGATSYTAENYCIDRWYFEQWSNTSPKVELKDGCLAISCTDANGDTNTNCIKQTIDNPSRYSGKTVTFSVKFKGVSVDGDPRMIIYSEGASGTKTAANAITASAANSILSVTTTLQSGLTRLMVIIGNYANSGGDGNFTLHMESAKLEIGSVSTLAGDVPPKKAEQILECQRYYIRFASDGGQWLMGASNGSTLYAPLHLPVPLRAFPDTKNGGFKYANVNIYPYVSGGKVEVTSLELTGASGTQDFMLYAHHASNALEAKQPGCIRFEAGGYVELSAEI